MNKNKKKNTILQWGIVLGAVSLLLAGCGNNSSMGTALSEGSSSSAETQSSSSIEIDLLSSANENILSSSSVAFDDSYVRGTQWMYKNSEWDYYSSTQKDYYVYTYILNFETDGTGTAKFCENDTHYVYNLVTEKWQTSSSTSCPEYEFEWEMTSSSTMDLLNLRSKGNDPSRVTWTISKITSSTLHFDQYSKIFTKN